MASLKELYVDDGPLGGAVGITDIVTVEVQLLELRQGPYDVLSGR
jgi:hypothetical protein